MSDDGSEMDSKYNVHPSFVIVISFKYQISTMLVMFRLFLVLYFIVTGWKIAFRLNV